MSFLHEVRPVKNRPYWSGSAWANYVYVKYIRVNGEDVVCDSRSFEYEEEALSYRDYKMRKEGGEVYEGIPGDSDHSFSDQLSSS